MKPLPALLRLTTDADEQKIRVANLIRRIDGLMKDGRYPPLHNQKVVLNIPFRIRYPRT